MALVLNLNSVIGGNTVKEYLVALGIFIIVFTALKLFDSVVIRILKRAAGKTKFQWDDFVIDFIDAIHWQFYAFLGVYISSRRLELPVGLSKSLYYLLIIFIGFYVAQGLGRMVDGFTERQIDKRKKHESAENTSMIRVFGRLFKIAIWGVAILMILANFGVEITPLIASLGIGGIAIALAVQAILGDLFSAFVIYFDKPFKEGDFIIIGNDMGTVTHIGIKSTRILTLQGQELIVSNSELTNSRINNYKRMENRRIVFTFGVEYTTSIKKMKKIDDIVKKIVGSVKGARLDRVHFKEFGDSSLNYEVVYYVLTPDYNEYMDIQEKINFKLKEAFDKEKISFAFPTQTVYLKKQ